MINYDLHRLGWYNFQQLCLQICRQIMGQTVQSFLETRDGGRDGAFTGVWSPKSGESISGKFVIQCKFSIKPGKNLSPSDLSGEYEKVERMVREGRVECYIIMTNMGLSAEVERELREKIDSIGVKHFLAYGGDWICSQIKENKMLRTSVPRLYGLGDLSEIIDERAYQQGKALLASLKDDLIKVVITSAYNKASQALADHGFVLLVGSPAAGKTTVALLLAMMGLDHWGLRMLKFATAEKVKDHWNPNEPDQLFWIDDAFGANQYEAPLARQWNAFLPEVRAMLDQGARIVMTSRDYIYRSARNDLKTGAFPLFNESQVVVDVHDLTLQERQQILYNHIKLGKQSTEFKSKLKPYLGSIASNDRFIPETARRLGDPLFTKNLALFQYSIDDFVSKQEQLLKEVVLGLDIDSKAALGLIYIRNNFLESPVTVTEDESEILERMGSSLGKALQALQAMDGSLLTKVTAEDRIFWSFKHPTISDAFASILSETSELLGVFLYGAQTDKILTQVTCGDVGLENTIVLSRQHFPTVITKVKSFFQSDQYKTPGYSTYWAKRTKYSFLAKRCTRSFLAQYLEQDDKLLSEISDLIYDLEYNYQVDLVVRLHHFDLLPEEYRLKFVAAIAWATLENFDTLGLVDENIQTVLRSDELDSLRERVESELINNLGEKLSERVDEYRSVADTNTPEEHIDSFLGALNHLREAFADNEVVLSKIAEQERKAKEWVQGREEEEDRPKAVARKVDEVFDNDHFLKERSIFDDVDE